MPYLVDGCQALGQLVVDVEEIGCDALTGTGRKWLRGPRGTGLLYVRSSFQHRCDPPGIDGTSAFWESASSYSLAPTAARFEEFVTEVARVAPHVYNTDEEFDRLLVVIDAL